MRPQGPEVPDWQPPGTDFQTLTGRYARLTPLVPADAPALHAANAGEVPMWDYLYVGPFATLDAYATWVGQAAEDPGNFFYAVTDLEAGAPGGVASYLRISPEAGSIEVGNIAFSPGLQRTRAATEAMALMMTWAFAAGYRRYEWKCNALNRPSRRAAQRLGFSYEGTHRQAAVVKGRNRDTAWFSILNTEWPALREAFDVWLAPENFDTDGRQRQALSDLTRPLVCQPDDPG